MPKVSLNTIGSRYGSIDALNDNFDAIEAAIENTLSLDGTSPNAMTADLDLNSNDLLNVGTTNTQTLYINGVEVEPSTGVSAGSAFQTYSFTATAGQTTFSVAPATPLVSSLLVSVNGLELPPADVTVSTTNVVIPACTLGDEVVVRRFTKEPTVYPTAATQDFQQAGTGAQIRTVQSKLRDVVSVKDFGAVGDGVADDTTAINNALLAVNALGRVSLYFPAGIYRYAGGGWLGNGVVITGAGRDATTIRSIQSNPIDGYLFDCRGYGSGIRSMRFDALGTTQTGGSYVWLKAPESFIDDFHMTNDINGILMTGNVSRIRHGRFQDGAVNATRIRAEGGDNSQLIDDVLMGAQSPQVSFAGIRVRNSSALIISNTSVIQQGYGLLIDPYSNTTGSNTVDTDSGSVFSLYAHHCFFDNNSQDAVRVAPTGNASVARIRFDNCWMSSSTNDGIYINNAGTGTLQGVHFESCHVGLNGGSGLTSGGTVSDIQVLGGWFCQNLFGLYFNNGASNITVSGCTIGSGAGLSGNTNNGIVLDHTSINNVVITNNRMVGNGGAAIIDNSTGANKIIFNNTGASSVGTSIDISGPAGGQIRFPATQNPSADVNTLDDYEEGNWTPTLTFATPGDLSVSYTSNTGQYTKIGRMVVVRFQIVTSAFTWTTASGDLTINSLPFTAAAGFDAVGSLWCGGITKASYTMFVPSATAGATTMRVRASGSGQSPANVVAADVPSGGSVALRGTVTYFV